MNGIELIAKERQEQIEKHGRTIEQDVQLNTVGQLGFAVVSLCSGNFNKQCPVGWDKGIWMKMIAKPYAERLVIAGALIAAEIDRLQALER